ncbi:Tc toxin subunit A [Pseudomonas sp. B26(2017)]|uniref:Tc toxin subunit A n=1 Tax=Pseudomonas sp. B26(2017) TaxID=1981732 RepID=UPI000A1EDB67|nr:Tc toxin subunit A [Pseudomonas sp. B26(2017)]
MAKTRKRPAEQMYEQLFPTRARRKKYPGLQAYLSQGGSIFPLVEKGIQGLVKDYRMSREDAQAFLRQASSMAIYIRRRFIEHTLTGGHQETIGKAQKKAPSSGLLSMVPGPTFETLLNPNFDGSCPPSALESRWSPVAYLVELLQWVSERIEKVGNTEVDYLLHNRRTDLKRLVVDFNAVYQSISAVDIINQVLETYIKTHGAVTDLVDALIEARYPNELPYFQHWVTVDSITRQLGMSVGNFAHMVDLQFPYFLQAHGWGDEARRALAHASRLGPYQRTLLTEARVAFADREDFFNGNYGSDNYDKYQNLNQLKFFGERTSLDVPGIESLLSFRAYSPVRSANVTFADEPPPGPQSARFGSVYVNAATEPPIVVADDASLRQTLTIDPDRQADFEFYDRLNRKVRLDKWLNVRSFEVDAMLAAAMRAEVRGGATAGEWWITGNVVHALGLFQLLRERYGCKALDFAVFLDEMPVYGIGEERSLFDQVFNGQDDYRQPFMLDGQDFPAIPAAGSSDPTVIQLCSGLQIDLLTYGYLALAIADALGLGKDLERTPVVVSAFYRLVKLARLLGVTPVEIVLMLTLMGEGKSWLKGLAGLPRINTRPGETPDVLNLIYALHSCVVWCKDRNLPVLGMLQMVAEPQASGTASAAQLQFFDNVASLLPAALLTNAGILMADVPPVPAGNWLNFLASLADADGLVLDFAGSESQYLIEARLRLDRAVQDGLPVMAPELRAAIVEKMLGVLLQAREAQVSLAKEALAVLTSLDSELVIGVLTWADTTVYRLLREVSERVAQNPQNVRSERLVELDPLLKALANVQRLSAVVTALGLSAAVLQEYLDYGHRAWLGQSSKHEFSMSTLYYLTALTRAFEMSEQPAQELLDYLRAVGNLPDNIAGDSLRLTQEAGYIKLARFFRWSVEEVRDCVVHIDPSLRILKTLRQLDLLMRIRTLAEHSGMDARTIFKLGNLPESIDKAAYADAAEHALLSQSETRAPDPQFPLDVEQLVVRTCVVDNTDVVANKPGAKITYTVTLKDAEGAPLKGIRVLWQASLGTIETKTTDENGELRAEFIPGSVLGSDAPSFWMDLFKPVSAPEIRVVPDAQTLFFPGPLMSLIPLTSVQAGEEVQLYAELRDDFKNIGANQLVEWFAEPVEGDEDKSVIIRPSGQAFTDRQGLTKVFIHAPEGGMFRFSVRSQSSDISAVFEPIHFLPPA